MSCGVDCRHGLDLVLLWLWHKLAGAALIQSIAWELLYAMGVALKKKKKGLNRFWSNEEPKSFGKIDLVIGKLLLSFPKMFRK